MGRWNRRGVFGVLATLALGCGLGGAPVHAQDDPTAVVRPDHQAEDVNRLLDAARARGQSVVIRLEPAAGDPKPVGKPAPAPPHAGAARRAEFESSLLGGWHDAIETFGLGLQRGVEGIDALPAVADEVAQRWRAARNATSSLDALARLNHSRHQSAGHHR